MQQSVDELPVGPVGERLLDQPTQTAKVAFKAAKLQTGFLVLQAGHGEAKTDFFTEGRK